MLNLIFPQTADMIFDRGAFKFGAFPLKLHEKNPNALLSPFYINLRDKNNPKPGPLKDNDYILIARCNFKVLIKRDDDMVFDAIAGIPRAGDPIVKAMSRIEETTDINQGDYRIIMLAKEEDGERRKIVPLPGFEYKEGERVLLVDDLVTQADTKIEAIKAIESSGSKVVGLIVLIDREQGGRELIEEAGYLFYSVFTISQLLNYYRQSGRITQKKYQECMDYIARS